jgi:hypothetical protein
MKYEEMLGKLFDALANLPDLLADRSAWDSLIVNRRKPYTYRVFATLPNGLRVCLHKFDPCHTHEAFSHPHPWPGAFVILQGKYKMNVGYSCNGREDSNPADVTTLILNRHSSYEIVNPLTWHSVIPLETTYTVMVNDAAWDTETFAHKDVRTTKGKDLDKMPEEELIEHLNVFKQLVAEWNESVASQRTIGSTSVVKNPILKAVRRQVPQHLIDEDKALFENQKDN